MGVTNHLHIFHVLYPFPSPAPSQGWQWVCTAALVPLCHPACPLLFWLCHGKSTLSQASAGSGVFLAIGAGARCLYMAEESMDPWELPVPTAAAALHLQAQTPPSAPHSAASFAHPLFPLAGAVFPLSAFKSRLYSPCSLGSCLPSHSPLAC